jgi:hypothetical protein
MVNAVLYALNHTRSLMFFVSCHAGKYVKGPMHVDRRGDTSHQSMFLESCICFIGVHTLTYVLVPISRYHGIPSVTG